MTDADRRTPEEWVACFADSAERFPAYMALQALGQAALPAIHEGLGHGDWQVRKWSAMFLDHHSDDHSFELLKPLLRDPKMDVRLWATHSIACDRCKEGECPIDYIPLMIERIEMDESIRVRRMAVCMLAEAAPDARALPALKRIVTEESDRKLVAHAERTLKKYREVGLG